MDQLLTQFIGALRNADVRISTAETLDALSTVELVGYSDRRLLKDSLALALPKTLDEKAAFDTCFDQFFSFREHHLEPPETIADGEGAADTIAAGQSSQSGQGQAGSGGDSQGQSTGNAQTTGKPDAGAMSDPRSALGQLLVRGNAA